MTVIASETDAKDKFFKEFYKGFRTKAEYNNEIATMADYASRFQACIAEARSLYAGNPKKIADIDRLEANAQKILEYAQKKSQNLSLQSTSELHSKRQSF